MRLPGELGQARSLPEMLSLSWGIPVVQSLVSPRPLVPCRHPHVPLDASECCWSDLWAATSWTSFFLGGEGGRQYKGELGNSCLLRDEDLGLLRGVSCLLPCFVREKAAVGVLLSLVCCLCSPNHAAERGFGED